MQVDHLVLFLARKARMIISIITGVLLLAGGIARAQWTVKRTAGTSTAPPHCYVESATVTVYDGYQETHARLIVRADAIVIHTDAPLDASFGDIGLQVDTQAFVLLDSVSTRKMAVFTSQYARLIEQFKQGSKARLQLRFWPTWPATGPHAATASLIGFSKAYTAMQACPE
jgi:hypothetical protein